MSEFDQLENDNIAIEEEEKKENPLDNLSPEDRQGYFIEKTKLVSKILRYRELFSHHLSAYDFKLETLDKLEIRELEYLLQEISVIINTRNSSGLTKILYFESVGICEKLAPVLGLKLGGLKEALSQNQQIHDVLNELSLKYETDMYLAPELRLAYITSSSIIQLHKLNSSKNVLDSFLKANIPKEKMEEYKDL